MEKLTVTAKREGTNERLVGTGVNVFDGHALLYNKYASYQVDPDTIRLNCPRTLPEFENPSVEIELLEKLHDKLVQTAIDFIKEHNIKSGTTLEATNHPCTSIGLDEYSLTKRKTVRQKTSRQNRMLSLLSRKTFRLPHRIHDETLLKHNHKPFLGHLP